MLFGTELMLMSRRGPNGISAGSWLGMASMAAVGVVGGALALVAGMYTELAGQGRTAGYVVFAGLTVIPSMLLWRTGNRYLRGTAVGLAGAFLIVLILIAWHPWATMSDEEVERAKAEVLASGHPAVYLGDAVAGYPLNEYDLGGGEANFYYGSCHPRADDVEEVCAAWDISIHNSWRNLTIGEDAIAGCVRQAPVAGVPTVHLHDPSVGSDEVVLLTGDSQVTIRAAADSSLEWKLRIAREVRRVGAAEAATSLPAPPPLLRAYVERHCLPAG